jgi:hypothetical protein
MAPSLASTVPKVATATVVPAATAGSSDPCARTRAPRRVTLFVHSEGLRLMRKKGHVEGLTCSVRCAPWRATRDACSQRGHEKPPRQRSGSGGGGQAGRAATHRTAQGPGEHVFCPCLCSLLALREGGEQCIYSPQECGWSPPSGVRANSGGGRPAQGPSS